MLDRKVFLQGINYLKCYYLNWNFDLNNDMMIAIWYKKFSFMDKPYYMQVIENYTQKNRFAPQSPADLLEVAKEDIEKKQLNAHEAWLAIEKIKSESMFLSEVNFNEVFVDKPILLNTIEMLKQELLANEFSSYYSNKNFSLADKFKKVYNENLKKYVDSELEQLVKVDKEKISGGGTTLIQ